MLFKSTVPEQQLNVLNFDRESVGVNKLQTDSSALLELKAAWGKFPAFQ